MEITMFIAHMALGGSQRVCINLANEFVKNGNKVNIIVLDLNNDVNSHLLDERCHVHSLNVKRIRYAALPMIHYIKKNKPKFILVFGNEMTIVLNKLRQLHLVKTHIIVRVLNNLNISLSKEDHISLIVENYLKNQQKQLRNVDHVIAQCNGMGEMLLENRLVEKENLTTIYNPVSSELLEKTAAIRLPFAKRNKERVREIVFIGRIDPQKNLSHLLTAFALVHNKNPLTKLRMIGKGNVVDSMKELVDKLGIKEAVSFEGVRKDIEQIYATADMVVLSSEYEGMPNCLIEAIGCGIPIVSYDCPLGPAEIVQNQLNGFLVEYNNKEQLAECMEEALSHDWDEDTIKKTSEKFCVQEIAKQYMEIFNKFE